MPTVPQIVWVVLLSVFMTIVIVSISPHLIAHDPSSIELLSDSDTPSTLMHSQTEFPSPSNTTITKYPFLPCPLRHNLQYEQPKPVKIRRSNRNHSLPSNLHDLYHTLKQSEILRSPRSLINTNVNHHTQISGVNIKQKFNTNPILNRKEKEQSPNLCKIHVGLIIIRIS